MSLKASTKMALGCGAFILSGIAAVSGSDRLRQEVSEAKDTDQEIVALHAKYKILSDKALNMIGPNGSASEFREAGKCLLDFSPCMEKVNSAMDSSVFTGIHRYMIGKPCYVAATIAPGAGVKSVSETCEHIHNLTFNATQKESMHNYAQCVREANTCLDQFISKREEPGL